MNLDRRKEPTTKSFLRKEEDIVLGIQYNSGTIPGWDANIGDKKTYAFYEIVMTYFEVNYRMKKDISQIFIDRIFKDSLNIENLKDFEKFELISNLN
jgi:hypothetical protein